MQQNSLFFLLIQIFLCLFSIQIMAPLFEKIKAPRIFAEISAGLLLGPTVLKNISPVFYHFVFSSNQDSLLVFSGFQDLGLLLLMFCSGLEVEFLAKGKEKGLALVAGIVGVLFPFSVAFFFSDYFDLSQLMGENGNIASLKYFFAISCSITSIPVISRIFIDLNLIRTKFATICLSIALIEDLLLYAIMALFISLGSRYAAPSYMQVFNLEHGGGLQIFLHIAITGFMITACFKLFPYIILKLRRYLWLKKIFLNYLALSFLILLFVSILSIFLGIPSFLGPFLAGIIIGKTPLQNSEHLEHIKRFSFSTFVPIFFVGIGLKLDLLYAFDIKFFLLFIVLSSLIKITGVTLSCLLVKIKSEDAWNFGVALNARGGPGIVLASVGLAAGWINESYFVALVLTALFTSWFASFWFNLKRKQIESYGTL